MNRIDHSRKFAGVAILLFAACNAQMLVEEEPADEPWAGNAADCPATPVEGTVCTVAEGQVCALDYEDMYNAGYRSRSLCGCFEASSSERRWYCYMGESGPGECPATEPSNGASCYGHYGTSCAYPERSYCTCSGEDGVWSCEEQGRDDLTAPPSSVPEGKAITALSDEERAEWCDWYTTTFNGPGYPEPADSVVDSRGFTVNTGCNLGGAFPCQAMVPPVSSAYCEANLRLSSCEAPIAELSDCLVTVMDSCWPSPHGCARFLERPGCSGTIVVSYDGTSGGTGAGGTGAGGTGGSVPGGTTGGTNGGPSDVRDSCSIRVR